MPRSQPRHRDNIPSARRLRTSQTDAEATLWKELRGRNLNGLKFRRQHPIGLLVADFCCPERRLIVELDGGVHETQAQHDAEREALLASAGYQVLRFQNEAITADLAGVLATIARAAIARPITPPGELSRTSGW